MRFLVMWQFMGPQSVSFDCLVDAIHHAHNLLEEGLPSNYVHIEPLPF